MAKATKPETPFGKPVPNDTVFEFVVPEDTSLRIPAGPYMGRCVGVKQDVSKEAKNPMYVWDFVITKGKYAGRDFRLWTSLTANAMWKLIETLAAFGVKGKVGEKLQFTKEQVKGVMVTLVIEDDSFNGRDTSRIAKLEAHPNGAGFRATGAFDAPAPVEDEDEDEETPVAAAEEEEEAVEEVDDDVVNLSTMDRSELKAFIKEQGLPVKVTTSMSDGQLRTAIEAAVNAIGEEPEEEEEEEEEAPVAVVKKPATPGKATSSLKKK